MYSAQFGGRAGRSKGKAPKSKKKKCPVCGKKGYCHKEDQCPTIAAGGNGGGKQPPLAIKATGGAGSGRGNRVTRRAKGRSAKGGDHRAPAQLPLPAGFLRAADFSEAGAAGHLAFAEARGGDPFLYFDAACDVGAVLDTIARLASEKKLKSKEPAGALYRRALDEAACNYGGCVCRQYLKPNRPWDANASRAAMIREPDPRRLWWSVGLGPGFLARDGADDASSEEDENEGEGEAGDDGQSAGVEALVAAATADPSIVGFFANLDYAILHRKGQDRDAQLRRFRASCTAAQRLDLPLQVSISPTPLEVGEDGSSSSSNGKTNTATMDAEERNELYTQVCRDLAKILVACSPSGGGGGGGGEGGGGGNPTSATALRVHLTNWSGKCEQMVKLLGAFPDTLFVGMTARVGFAKAAMAHACAFDVPLNRLLLETGAPLALPAQVATFEGKGAFCHSGCIPFVAEAIATHKKTVSAMEVARAATKNIVGLYGRGLGARAAEAAAEAASRAEEATKALADRAEKAAAKKAALQAAEAKAAAQAAAEGGDSGGGGEGGEDEDEGGRGKKKKKKKKKRNKNERGGEGGDRGKKKGGDGDAVAQDEAAAADVDLGFF
jgi:Tat protein secretion system quality control protein TatD with DNase activity